MNMENNNIAGAAGLVISLLTLFSGIIALLIKHTKKCESCFCCKSECQDNNEDVTTTPI